MYLWSDFCQNQMYDSASNIVSPSFVKVSKRLELQLSNTVGNIVILLVRSSALLLNGGAEDRLHKRLHEDIVEVCAGRDAGPCCEVGDPGLQKVSIFEEG